MGNRHDWLSWDQYLAAHYSNLERFPSFIQQSTLQPLFSNDTVYWDGVLQCPDGVELHVMKKQLVRYRHGRPEVRTDEYAYHALRQPGAKPILRYDNAHTRPGHPDQHHKHTWDPDGTESVLHVGEAGWPTLGDVLAELEERWYRFPPVT